MVEYTTQIVDRAKSFDYEDLYPDDEPARASARSCEAAGPRARLVLPLSRATRTSRRDDDCEFRIWKDKSGRYMDRHNTATTLLEQKETRAPRRLHDARRAHLQGRAAARRRASWCSRPARPRASGPATFPSTRSTRRPLGPCPMGCGSEVIETPTQLHLQGGPRARRAPNASEEEGAGRSRPRSPARSSCRARSASARSRATRRRPTSATSARRCSTGLHLALRPAVLGHALPQGERPPRLRVRAPARPAGGAPSKKTTRKKTTGKKTTRKKTTGRRPRARRRQAKSDAQEAGGRQGTAARRPKKKAVPPGAGVARYTSPPCPSTGDSRIALVQQRRGRRTRRP